MPRPMLLATDYNVTSAELEVEKTVTAPLGVISKPNECRANKLSRLLSFHIQNLHNIINRLAE